MQLPVQWVLKISLHTSYLNLVPDLRMHGPISPFVFIVWNLFKHGDYIIFITRVAHNLVLLQLSVPGLILTLSMHCFWCTDIKMRWIYNTNCWILYRSWWQCFNARRTRTTRKWWHDDKDPYTTSSNRQLLIVTISKSSNNTNSWT